MHDTEEYSFTLEEISTTILCCRDPKNCIFVSLWLSKDSYYAYQSHRLNQRLHCYQVVIYSRTPSRQPLNALLTALLEG